MTNITAQSELKRRTDLVENEDFRRMVRDTMVKAGITSEQWESDKMAILMMTANEFCGIENEENKDK